MAHVLFEGAVRAVYDSDRLDPDILDTLAEVQYVVGDPMAAIQTIDEAIRLAAGEEYFIEQRRRFTGERDWEDRPHSPGLPWIYRNPDGPISAQSQPEIEV